MKFTIRIAGRELLDVTVDTGRQPDQPQPRPPLGFGPGQTLRLDHPPQRAGQRAVTRPARADQEDHRG